MLFRSVSQSRYAGSDYFIQELSPEFLRSSLKRARTEVEKENIRQLIDGNQQGSELSISRDIVQREVGRIKRWGKGYSSARTCVPRTFEVVSLRTLVN